MQTIRVAAVTMNGLLGQVERNLDEIERWTGKAVEESAELILFPELVVPGHCDPNTWYNAELVPEGPSTQRLCELANRMNVVLSVGLAEKERDIVYNTQVLVGPEGYIGSQRKIHLSRDEVLYYKGGSEFPVFDIGKCRVGTVICYDNSFPETGRMIALHGADVLLMPHAARLKLWTDDPESERAAVQHSHWWFRTMYPIRARENACFAIIADHSGRGGYVDIYPKESPNQPHHAGGCLIIDPDGGILAESQSERVLEEMVVADLTAEALDRARSNPNYTLRTRRPELFGDLVRVPDEA